MFDIETYNLQIDKLRKWIKTLKTFNSAIELALEIHAITHTSKVSFSGIPTFCDEWMTKLNVTVKDTGNAMTDEQIIDFSEQVNKPELINYRNAVGHRTREILKSLTPNDLKRKPGTGCLARLVSEGGLLEVKNSIWLKDFWGKHTVAGLILLPLTRHHMMHLPDSAAIKQFIKKNHTP
jgi:hypothetical protein